MHVNKIDAVTKRRAIIFFLIFSIVGLMIYGIFSYNNFTNKSDEKNKILESYEQLSLDDKLIQELFLLTGSSGQNLFENSKYENFYYTAEKREMKKVSNEFKLLLSYYTLDQTKFTNEDGKIVILESDLKEQYFRIFGDDDYEPMDINYSCPALIEYNTEKNRYEYDSYCGGMKASGYNYKLIEARQYPDRIEIYEKIAFYLIDANTETVSYWKNSDYSDVITELSTIEDFYIENYLDRLHTYKYTFRKNENNYYFEKVELSK